MPVQPGDSLSKIKATEWNAVRDLAADIKRRQLSGFNIPDISSDHTVVHVSNTGDSDIPAYSTILITDIIAPRSDAGLLMNPADLNRNMQFSGEKFYTDYDVQMKTSKTGTDPNYTITKEPEFSYKKYRYFRFGITVDPIPAGAAGRVSIYGLFYAWAQKDKFFGVQNGKNYPTSYSEEWTITGAGRVTHRYRRWQKTEYTRFYGAIHNKFYLQKVEFGQWWQWIEDQYNATYGHANHKLTYYYYSLTQPLIEIVSYTDIETTIEGERCVLIIGRWRTGMDYSEMTLNRIATYSSEI